MILDVQEIVNDSPDLGSDAIRSHSKIIDGICQTMPLSIHYKFVLSFTVTDASCRYFEGGLYFYKCFIYLPK